MGALISGDLMFESRAMITDAEVLYRNDMKAHELMVKDTLEHQMREVILRSVINDTEWEQTRKRIRWRTLDMTGMMVTPGLDDDDIRESSRTSGVQEDREGEH